MHYEVENHYGKRNIIIRGMSHKNWRKPPPIKKGIVGISIDNNDE